jgi:hypothetical protein
MLKHNISGMDDDDWGKVRVWYCMGIHGDGRFACTYTSYKSGGECKLCHGIMKSGRK